MGRFEAFAGVGHQCEAQPATAGIVSVCGASQVAACQNRDIVLFQQGTCEGGVGAAAQVADACPQVEACVGQPDVQHVGEHRSNLGKLLAIEAPVLDHVFLIAPGGHAGALDDRAHGTAVIGAVKKEPADQFGIARDESNAQTGHIAALGQAGEHHQVAQVGAAKAHGGFQSAERGLVAEIDFAVALVGGDDEARPVREREEHAPFVERHDGARGVPGGTHIHELGALPGRFWDAGPVHGEVACRIGGRVERRGSGQQGGSFVDLVERIGADHHGVGIGIDHGLCKGEQGLARAVDAQNLPERVDLHSIAPLQPLCAAGAQGRFAGSGRVGGQPGHAHGSLAQGFGDEGRGGVPGLADAEADGAQGGIGDDVGKQCAQTLEGVRLQQV